MLKHEADRQEKAAVETVSPLCAGFGVEVETVPMSRVFGQRWAVCGAAAVWGSHDAVILDIQNIQFQQENASEESRWGPLGRSILVFK